MVWSTFTPFPARVNSSHLWQFMLGTSWGESLIASNQPPMMIWADWKKCLMMTPQFGGEKPRLLVMFRACGERSPGCYSHVQSMWREKPRLLVMFRACKREKPRLLFMFRACGEWSPGCYSRSERVEREASVSSHVQSMGRREDPGSSHVRSVLREASVSSHVHVCGEPPLCHVSERAERSRSF